MKKNFLLGVFLAFTISMPAAITINFGAADLRTAGGSALIPDNSLVYVVASTTDTTFNPPTSSGFVSGDDIIIASGPATSGTWGFPLSASYSGDWNAGDRLQLYWFPSSTSISTPPNTGDSYGAYRTEAVSTGSDIAWVSPADNFNGALSLLTLSSPGGTIANSAGYADFTVAAVPEPSTYGMVFGFFSLAGAIALKRIRK